jgi:acetyl esterase/lipase
VAEDRRILDRAGAPGPESQRYGSHADQVAERWPGTDRCVVLLHGGFWRQAYDRSHLRPLAWAVAGSGAAVVLPEYRRVGGAGGWPATFDDVAAAVAWVADGWTGGLVLAGHSAGGHLALWAAASAGPSLTRVVGMAPVADLTAAHRLRLDDDAVGDLLGGRPEETARRLAAADPALLRTPDCPVHLLHARDDELVPFALSQGYQARHPAARLEEVPGGHFGVIDPSSPAWPSVRGSLLG